MSEDFEIVRKALAQIPREILREPFPENPDIDEMKAIRSWWQAEVEKRLAHIESQLRSLTEENEVPVNAVCEQTWRRDVQGACPVHGGDSCLVSPSGLTEENERLKEENLRLQEAIIGEMADRNIALADKLSEAEQRAARYGKHIETARRLLNSIVEAKHPETMSYYWYEAVDRFLRETIEIPEALSPIDPPLAQEGGTP